MKKTFKEHLNELGLSYTKEILIILLIALITIGALVAVILLLKEAYIAIIVFSLGVATMYLYISRYKAMEKTLERSHVNELISLLSYFEVLVKNQLNVHDSLLTLIPFSEQFFQDGITILTQQMELDQSVTPFINFANRFNNSDVNLLMLSMYQIKDKGLNEFDSLLNSVKEKYQKVRIEEHTKSLGFISSFPFIGAVLTVVALFIGIVSVMGDYINVI